MISSSFYDFLLTLEYIMWERFSDLASVIPIRTTTSATTEKEGNQEMKIIIIFYFRLKTHKHTHTTTFNTFPFLIFT